MQRRMRFHHAPPGLSVEDIDRILQYLLTDQASQLYQMTGDFRRIEHQAGEEQHHREALNALLQRAVVENVSYAEIEPGIFYYAGAEPDPDILRHIVAREP